MTTNPASADFTPSLISPDIAILGALGVAPLPPSKPLKLGIMASGSGSNFEAVARAIASQQLNAQIQVLIYNNPGIKAAARAEKWGVPLYYSIIETTRSAKNWIAKLSTPCGNTGGMGCDGRLDAIGNASIN
jgi:hypothetical protein